MNPQTEQAVIDATENAPQLTARWTPLRWHAEQQRYWTSVKRFCTVPAGRRSGKTELGKRKIIKAALRGNRMGNARFAACAPTHAQAKRIFWDDLKSLTPRRFMQGRPSESELVIRYVNGTEVHVIGMDKPERIEGSPWDGILATEIANLKSQAWPANMRPALADRTGWGILEGVPEGRNHYYDLDLKARADTTGEWDAFHWKSADILLPEEIASARADLDELTFQQEYEASFLNFFGRAYYAFDQRTHCATLKYDPQQPIIFTFDFNISPGTAAVIQEQVLPGGQTVADRNDPKKLTPLVGTGVIGEVFIPRNSNTPAVCNKLIEDWGKHPGRVLCYGDATGGAGGTAKVDGSDWDIIKKYLGKHFNERIRFNVQSKNPRERARINAVNTRLRTGSGHIYLMVDPAKAPHVVKDFDGVLLLEGGSGEIDKDDDSTKDLTHLTDGIGYYIEQEFPIESRVVKVARVIGV